MAGIPFLSAWSDFACAGGAPLKTIPYGSCLYGEAKDNTDVCTVDIRREDAALLQYLSIRNVLRVRNELDRVLEYYISNLQDDIAKPYATVTAKPVEHMLNRAMVIGLNDQGRRSTVIRDPLLATEWISEFAIPSLAAYGQGWWTAGTCDIDAAFSLSFVDQSVLYLVRQLLDGQTDVVLRARRNGEIGYFLDLVDISVALTSLAVVGRNVTALSREIDDQTQATVLVPQGQTFSGNDEPERIWLVPWRVASISGLAMTLEDPSGQGTTILGSDGQPFISTNHPHIPGMDWRLGCIAPGIYWNGPTSYSTYRNLRRMVRLPGTQTMWAAFVNTIDSINLETRVQGTAQTTSLSQPVDLYYDATAGILWVTDTGNATVIPYTLSGPTAGTPISVGTAPLRSLWISDGGLNRLLIGHGGSNAIKQINTSTLAVSATSTTMTTPAHMTMVSKTQVYVASDSTDDVYRYNASANTVGVAIATGITPGQQNAASVGYASIAYCAAQQQVWACQHRAPYTPPLTAITIIDVTTDTIVGYIPTTGVHGQIVDCTVVNGLFYGVTDDGLFVCYNPATQGRVFMRRHAAVGQTMPAESTGNNAADWTLQSLTYLPDLDCFALGGGGCGLVFMDAQTGGAMIARALTAANAAAPSVTLANSVFPLMPNDEVAFCRDDGLPMEEIPNEDAIAAYDPIQRPVLDAQLRGGTNRVQNGDMVWFDSSRKSARFLNLKLPTTTCEAKWDGYTDNSVRSFPATVDGTQATVGSPTYAPQGYTFRSVGAGRVFLPGDFLQGSTDFMVMAKATADGTGHVTVYAVASNTAGVTDGAAMVVNRPDAETLLDPDLGSPTWVALPQMADSFVGARSSLFADCLLPFIPGETTNLYYGIEAYHFGLNITSSDWRARIQGVDRQRQLLDTLPSPTAASGLITIEPIFVQSSLGLPDDFAGGHVQFALEYVPGLAGPHLGCLYIKKLWIQVGNADRGAPDLTAWPLWGLGQGAGVLLGNPRANYVVAPLEDNPGNPFTLGGNVQLQDAEQGILQIEDTISITRALPNVKGEVQAPQIVLAYRDPSFVQAVVDADGV